MIPTGKHVRSADAVRDAPSGAATATWNGILREHARSLGAKHAYVMLHGAGETGQALTFGELRASTNRIASSLAGSLPPQSRLLLLLPQGLSFIKAYLSCLSAGMIAVPVYLPHNGKQVKKVEGIFANAQPHAILWSEAATPKLRQELQECRACESASWIDVDAAEAAREQADGDADRDPDPDWLAMLQYTSGSTGDPKGVMLTHRNLLANQEMIRETFGHTSASVVVACLPMYHDMGLIGNILQPLYVGATCFLLSPQDVVRQPLSWLQSISRHRATTSGGPNAYYELCVERIADGAIPGDLDLSCWNVAFNGAEPIRSSTIETFTRKFAPSGFRHSTFLPVYGLAEASLLVTGARRTPVPTIASLDRTEYERARIVPSCDDASRSAVTVVGCGLPAPGVEIVIRGSDGRDLGEREVGEILVGGASVARGYWRTRSDDVFVARPDDGDRDDGARLLRTGDLGFVSEGELFVTGRLKECIIVRGRNYYPADIEATATQACDATGGARSAAFPVDAAGREEVVVVQEVARDNAVDLAAVRRAINVQCWMEHGIHLYDVVLVRTGTVPRTTSGKTRRAHLRQLYTANELPALDARAPGGGDDRDVLRTWLIDTCRSYVPGYQGAIDAGTPLSDLGLDSYSLVRFADEIGQWLGVEVPLVDLAGRSTIAEVADDIAGRRDIFAPRRGVWPGRERAHVGTGSRIRQTHGQIALWNRHATTSHAAALTVSRAVRVGTRLDPDVFEAAVAALVRRHDILRTEPKAENGDHFQIVVSEQHPRVEHVDAVEWDEARVRDYLEERANARLDIVNGELWRWSLLTRPTGSIVLFAFHHIICDLETINILIEDLFNAYAAKAAGRVEPAGPGGRADSAARYADYAERQYAFLDCDAGQRSRLVWDSVLRNVDLKVDIVSRKDKRARVSARACERLFDRASTAALRRRSAAANVGLNVLLLAAFAVVLKRYTHQERYAIGVPVSARTHHDFRQTLGYLVNVLPVAVDVGAARHVEDVVRQVRESMLIALEHQRYPLPLIVQQYRRDRPELARDPDIMNVVFVYQTASLRNGQDATAFAMNTGSGRPASVAGLELFSLPVRARGVEFPVKMTAGVVDDQLAVHLYWDDGTMYESVMSAMLDAYDGVLRTIVRASDLGALPIGS